MGHFRSPRADNVNLTRIPCLKAQRVPLIDLLSALLSEDTELVFFVGNLHTQHIISAGLILTYKIMIFFFAFVIPNLDGHILRGILDFKINKLVPFRLLTTALDRASFNYLSRRRNLDEGVHRAEEFRIMCQHRAVHIHPQLAFLHLLHLLTVLKVYKF